MVNYYYIIEKSKWNLIISAKNPTLLTRWTEDHLSDIVNHYKPNLPPNVAAIMTYLIYLFYNNDMQVAVSVEGKI